MNIPEVRREGRGPAMEVSGRYPPATRRAVEALLDQPALTMTEIAARSGVSYATVKNWNRKARIRPWNQAARLQADPRGWTARRARAVLRLFERDDIDPGDIAEALGSRRGDATALALACGAAAATHRPAIEPPGEVPDLASLDTALRGHIARQIAAFDDVLHGAGAGADSARVLRDLGGLKRLLDDVAMRADRTDSQGEADGGSPQDLSLLRDRLAQRIEQFVAGRRGEAAPGGAGPGAAPAAGA